MAIFLWFIKYIFAIDEILVELNISSEDKTMPGCILSIDQKFIPTRMVYTILDCKLNKL